MNYLFIGGPQRSGTSALARLLNQHPQIAIGIERYKYLFKRDRVGEVGPALFEPDRFLKIRRAETNIGAHSYDDFEAIRRKYDTVSYRGDKLPKIVDFHEIIAERFPDFRFVLLYRDPYRICSSWNVRVQRERRPWPKNRDYRMAVDQINRRVRTSVALVEGNRERYLPVRYEHIFDPDSSATLVALLERLGLEPVPEIMAAHAANAEKARTIIDKPLVEAPGQRDYIASTIDWHAYEELDRKAIR